MANLVLLGARANYDTNKKAVEKGQVIQLNGYENDEYAVYDIVNDYYGLNYKLINLRTHKFSQTEIILPLSKKHGIGFYFDDVNPQFLDDYEIVALRSEAERIEQAEQKEAQKTDERNEKLRAIGCERLQKLIPADAKAIIIAEFHIDESDSMTDYFGYRTERTVILGFSKHTKDLFSEMRKYAANFEGTLFLAEENKEYEHREKYSGGGGYYLGESRNRGWIVKKNIFYNGREQTIEHYSLIAGDKANICVKVQATKTETEAETLTGDFTIVDYSEKALAVFGNTRDIKEELMVLGGRFNPKLMHNGEKKAGWVFSKFKETELRNLLTIK
jgi:hypothetical protein